MKKILIVEDDEVVALDIRLSLEKRGYLVLGIANSREKALAMTAVTRPDLVLMDIELSGREDGILAAKTFRYELTIPVVFLTGRNDLEMLHKAALTEPFGYLLKPFRPDDLDAAIQMALFNFKRIHEVADSKNEDAAAASGTEKIEVQDDGQGGVRLLGSYLIIKDKSSLYRFPIDDVDYVEAMGNYVRIHCSQKSFTALIAMKEIEQILPNSTFFRIHRSYIVALARIIAVHPHELELSKLLDDNGALRLPIGKVYRAELLKKLKIGEKA